MDPFTTFREFVRRPSPRIAIKVKGRIRLVNSGDVVPVLAEGNYVLLQQESRPYLLRETISVVAEKLEPFGFVRIHRSVIVNCAFAEEITPVPYGRMRSPRKRREGVDGHPHL
jgi:DNA-binding LytR/AlgR family response regulator